MIIYFGSPNIENIMPNLFPNGAINGFNFDTLDDLIIFIDNMSDEEYFKRINIIKKERDTILQLFNFENHLSYLITKILERKGLKIEYDNNIIELNNINNNFNKTD